MGDDAGKTPGIHAEHDALSKLINVKLKTKKQLEIINILVIRLSKKNNLQSSKPCINCINIMKTMPAKKGYKINEIYYSNGEGNIIQTTLDDLDNEEKHYSRFYRKNNKIIIK